MRQDRWPHGEAKSRLFPGFGFCFPVCSSINSRFAKPGIALISN
jgi:hypothetical protein